MIGIKVKEKIKPPSFVYRSISELKNQFIAKISTVHKKVTASPEAPPYGKIGIKFTQFSY